MTTAYPMRCRFSEDCGTFSNAVALRKHYDTAHAGQYKKMKDLGRGICSACGVEIASKTLYSHRQGRHGGDLTVHLLPLRTVKAAPTPVVAPRPTHEHTAPDPEPLEPMTVDDIVLPAITALAMPGNVVPVTHLGALFLWRDQTAAMLAAISGKA